MNVPSSPLPKHVAIIMDGNGRWAERQGRPRTFGHARGVERVREIVKATLDHGISVLTLFAFSTENWRRPEYEISVLMGLFRRFILREVDDLDSAGIKLRVLGERERLPQDLQRMIEQVESRTAGNSRLVLQVALSYGGRAELVRAMQHLGAEVAAGRIEPEDIDEKSISDALYTGGYPDPDLVIRTSGEYRISNFLLWQAAYAEYAFVDVCWPDFTPAHYNDVLASFAGRERRYGGVVAR